MQNSTTILAVETSFDETAASILRGELNRNQPKFQILSSVVKSQIELHQKTKGVVPEVAARAQMQNILPVVSQALEQASLTLEQIDYLAVTSGPGLVVSLVVGTEFIKGLSLAKNIPILPTNHMAGHLYSAFAQNPKVEFPALSVIVSGNHTMLIIMEDYHTYRVIGQTLDDAAGEAFDKVARMLDLPYPGGPQISKLATNSKSQIDFPRPMINEDNYDFSFSGLKTAVLYYLDKYLDKQSQPLSEQVKADVAKAFEDAVVDVISTKALKACREYNCKTLTLSGGVAANQKLRSTLADLSQAQDIDFHLPALELCTDNAQMIAIAAYFNLLGGQESVSAKEVKADPAWELE